MMDDMAQDWNPSMLIDSDFDDDSSLVLEDLKMRKNEKKDSRVHSSKKEKKRADQTPKPLSKESKPIQKIAKNQIPSQEISSQEVSSPQEVNPQETHYELVRRQADEEEELLNILSRRYGVQSVNLKNFQVEHDVLQHIPVELCKKYKLMPLSQAGSSLIVAMMKPHDLNAIDDLRFRTNLQVEPVVSTERSILSAINRYYGEHQVSYDEIIDHIDETQVDYHRPEENTPLVALEAASGEPPVVRLCNAILINAIQRKASDIHVECFEKEIRIRYRVDGVLQKEMTPPVQLKSAIISRFKIMASMDIAERRLPQDGRIKLHLGQGREMDFRVSSIPTFWGEKVVLRLLDQSNLELDMTKLGFDHNALKMFKDSIHQPFGMVLVTGPTGSGKTTTLYSALSDLNTMDTNISTAEDPVEYDLPGINQVQMNEDIGLNFSTALRSFLRQDPDVVMIGEVRDFETAEMAIKASLTGHLVLSTLHTNDAPSTISRLLDMGIEPYLITSSLNLVVAQRLVRRLCPHCIELDPVEPQDLIDLGVKQGQAKQVKVYRGAGCHHCHDTGYQGRVALYEVMPCTPNLKRLVLQGGSTEDFKAEMISAGFQTLRQAGIQKMKEGLTSIKEVLRVTRSDAMS